MDVVIEYRAYSFDVGCFEAQFLEVHMYDLLDVEFACWYFSLS